MPAVDCCGRCARANRRIHRHDQFFRSPPAELVVSMDRFSSVDFGTREYDQNNLGATEHDPNTDRRIRETAMRQGRNPTGCYRTRERVARFLAERTTFSPLAVQRQGSTNPSAMPHTPSGVSGHPVRSAMTHTTSPEGTDLTKPRARPSERNEHGRSPGCQDNNDSVATTWPDRRKRTSTSGSHHISLHRNEMWKR